MMRRLVLLSVGVVILAACGGPKVSAEVHASGEADPSASLGERLGIVESVISDWREADSLTEAQIAAEAAANIVVGPNGPGYGDRNGDGLVSGESLLGVLPGSDGDPAGVGLLLVANQCVVKDVLGGDWDDPAARWAEMLEAIDEWRPGNNTMPSLASHPMRIVGWATFTLASDSLDEAHEYAGHAKLHVDVSLRALEC